MQMRLLVCMGEEAQVLEICQYIVEHLHLRAGLDLIDT